MLHERRGGLDHRTRLSSPPEETRKAARATTSGRKLSGIDLASAAAVWALWFAILAVIILSLCAVAWVVA
jgi:hypothetical protein